MKHQKKWLSFSIVLGFCWAVLVQKGDSKCLTVPLWFIGNALRKLSLSGVVGNVLAWAVVVLISVLPLGYMAMRKCKGRTLKADCLLPILSIQIGSFLYFLVNPTLTDYPGGMSLADGFALLYGWAIVATLVGYACLRVLKRINLDAMSGRHLPKLLRISGLVLVGLSSYNHLALLLVRVQTVKDSNMGDVSFTIAMLCVLALCALLPAVLGGVTLLWSGDVATAMMVAPYAEETIALCDKVARDCNAVTVCAVLVSLGCNFVQLLFASQLYQANITVELPLLTLLLSSALYLLCHYIGRAKALSDDNDSII